MEKKETKRYIPMEVTPETIRAFGFKAEDIKWTRIGSRKARVVFVEATKEQYLAYMRPLWLEDKREERTKKWEETHETARLVSLDKLFEETEFEFADPHDFLENLDKQQVIQDLHQALGTLEELDRTIAILFSENWTEAAIGKKVGLSQKAVNKRKKKIFVLLRELLEKKI